MIIGDKNLAASSSGGQKPYDSDGVIDPNAPIAKRAYEASRETNEGIIISVPDDVCLTGPNKVPVPYKIHAFQREATNLANTLRQSDLRTHVKDSIILHCYGDEKGDGGGIKSGTTGAECTPKTWSLSANAEDRPVVRDTDEWWMNHRNTWGVLNYMKDPNFYALESTKYLTPSIIPINSDGHECSLHQCHVNPQFDNPNGTPKYPPVPIPLPLPLPQLDKKKKPDLDPDPEPGPDRPPPPPPFIGWRNRNACKLIPWKDNTCAPGSQRHHVVGDRSMNVPGGRLLSYADGLTFCLVGPAFPRTLTTGHAVAQTEYDFETKRIAQANPDGMLSLGEAEYYGAQAAADGALRDGKICSAASFEAQLRVYHQEHGLSPTARVRSGGR